MSAPRRKEATLFSGLRSRLTYANVVSTLCLFILLGGSAYAAATIGSAEVVDDSLQSVDLRDNAAVKSRDVANEDVSGGGLVGSDIRPNALTGSDIDESSLGQVPSALDAEKLDGRDSGAFWTGKSYIATSPETDGGAAGTGTTQSVFCDSGTPTNPGDTAIGGGYSGLSSSEGTVTRTVPTSLLGAATTQEGWTVEWENAGTTTNRNVVIHVRCADIAPFHP